MQRSAYRQLRSIRVSFHGQLEIAVPHRLHHDPWVACLPAGFSALLPRVTCQLIVDKWLGVTVADSRVRRPAAPRNMSLNK